MNFTRKPWGNEERGRVETMTADIYYGSITGWNRIDEPLREGDNEWGENSAGPNNNPNEDKKKKKKPSTIRLGIWLKEREKWEIVWIILFLPPPFLSSFYEIPVISSSRISWLDWPAAASASRNPIFQRREAEPWIYGTSHAYIDAAA